ncbi:CYTH and CHAD domain-containing protein [Nitrobacter sp. JJSN]|uniref:CYTH and CHAD domain-containing protein n=1 Tax=Nitrobacter sp. JJSN TaxID=3453033 RepID=UPI003F772628
MKLWVSPEDIVALQNHPSFVDMLRSPSSETLKSVYFDSDSRLLRDHGFTLRVRHKGDMRIQTVKAANTSGGYFERAEWEQVIEGNRPDLTLVKDTALGVILVNEPDNALQPVFEIRIKRTAYHLNRNGADVVMAIDQGKIFAAGSSLSVSEIELKRGNPADLFKIARNILDIIPAHLEFKSKSERGYDLIEKAAITAETARDPELSPGMTAGRAFTLIGRACLRHLVTNLPAMKERDHNALHQMRVALRRLRAAISLFSPVVGDDRASAIKSELKWLTQEFGPARNLDTLLVEVIRPLRKRHPSEPGLVSISNMFARKRLKSYRQALEAVRSARFRRLVLDTVEWVETGPWSTSEDELVRARREFPVEIYAAGQLSQRRKKIRRLGARIKTLDPEQLHRLRIQVKKARYSIEFFSGLFHGKECAKRCKTITSSLVKLQNSLGTINDIVTHKTLFADIIARRTNGLTDEQNHHRAYAVGLIIGNQQAQVQRSFDRAHKAYSRFDRAKSFWKFTDPKRPNGGTFGSRVR